MREGRDHVPGVLRQRHHDGAAAGRLTLLHVGLPAVGAGVVLNEVNSKGVAFWWGFRTLLEGTRLPKIGWVYAFRGQRYLKGHCT